MALINCTECGRQISDKAVSCPGCGNPRNPPNIVFTDIEEPRSRRTGPSLFARAFRRSLVWIAIICAGYAAYHYDIGGIASMISQRTFLSSKLVNAENYLLERIENPETYERIQQGPLSKRYDYSRLGEVYETWLAFEFQDDFGNVKRQKAFFKIDAATEKVLTFKIE